MCFFFCVCFFPFRIQNDNLLRPAQFFCRTSVGLGNENPCFCCACFGHVTMFDKLSINTIQITSVLEKVGKGNKDPGSISQTRASIT